MENNKRGILFSEPVNEVVREGKNERSGEYEEVERKNPVIPYEIRKEALLKYHPIRIVEYFGIETGMQIDTYIYIIDNHYIAICEPLNGISTTKILDMGYKDQNINDVVLNIKAALEADNKVLKQDDAIIKKYHTTEERFNDNLEDLFSDSVNSERFKEDIEAAKNVYGGRR